MARKQCCLAPHALTPYLRAQILTEIQAFPKDP